MPHESPIAGVGVRFFFKRGKYTPLLFRLQSVPGSDFGCVPLKKSLHALPFALLFAAATLMLLNRISPMPWAFHLLDVSFTSSNMLFRGRQNAQNEKQLVEQKQSRPTLQPRSVPSSQAFDPHVIEHLSIPTYLNRQRSSKSPSPCSEHSTRLLS